MAKQEAESNFKQVEYTNGNAELPQMWLKELVKIGNVYRVTANDTYYGYRVTETEYRSAQGLDKRMRPELLLEGQFTVIASGGWPGYVCLRASYAWRDTRERPIYMLRYDGEIFSERAVNEGLPAKDRYK